MPIQEIDLSPEWSSGLDFGGFFNHQGLVESALIHLISPLPPTVGYCLRFCDVPDGESWFQPYAETGLATPSQPIPLPAKVNWRKVLHSAFHWPLLAKRTLGDPPPPVLPNAVWRGQVIIKNGEQFVGYFKIVEINGKEVTDASFRDAYICTKCWLDDKVAELRKTSKNRVSLRNETHSRIEDCVQSELHRVGLQHLATLLTSHLGAQLNRVAVFVPVGPKTLECVYAHGGEASNYWTGIEDFISHTVKDDDQLHGLVEHGFPTNDPLYQDLVGQQVSVHSGSLIARVWEQGAILDGLCEDQTIRLQPSIQIQSLNVDMPIRHSQRIAVIVDHGDAWLTEHQRCFPESSVFKSCNSQWFLIPWKHGEQRLGIFLFDLAHWSRWDIPHDLIPRLQYANELIEDCARHFSGISKWK